MGKAAPLILEAGRLGAVSAEFATAAGLGTVPMGKMGG